MRRFTILTISVVALLGVMSNSVQAAGSYKSFFSFLDPLIERADSTAGIPTVKKAYWDFANARSFVFSRELANVTGWRIMDYDRENYARIDYVLNWDEHVTGMKAMVVQLDIRYEAPVNVPQLGSIHWTDTTLREDVTQYYIYNKNLGKLIVWDKVFIYYLKSRDGWLYCGAESYLTGNAWSRMFNPNFGDRINSHSNQILQFKKVSGE